MRMRYALGPPGEGWARMILSLGKAVEPDTISSPLDVAESFSQESKMMAQGQFRRRSNRSENCAFEFGAASPTDRYRQKYLFLNAI